MKIILLLIICVCFSACDAIVWMSGSNGGVWARNCNFPGNDMWKTNIHESQCYSRCQQTMGCTHFSYKDGACWMKRGTVYRDNALDMPIWGSRCGIVRFQ